MQQESEQLWCVKPQIEMNGEMVINMRWYAINTLVWNAKLEQIGQPRAQSIIQPNSLIKMI